MQRDLIDAAGRAQCTRAKNLLKASAMMKRQPWGLPRSVHASDECSICLEPPSEPLKLPCGHTFCWTCVCELRRKGVSMTCPLCRADLPPCTCKLNWLGQMMIETLLQQDGEPITTSDAAALRDAIWLLCEAMDQVTGWPVYAPTHEHCDNPVPLLRLPQGHAAAAATIANVYEWGQLGERIDFTIAARARKVAAKGTCEDQWLLGRLYLHEGARNRSALENTRRALKWFKMAAAATGPCEQADWSFPRYQPSRLGLSWRQQRHRRCLAGERVRGYLEALTELGDCYFGGPTEQPSTDSMHATKWWPWRRRGPTASWLRAVYYWDEASKLGHQPAIRKLHALLAHVIPTVRRTHG